MGYTMIKHDISVPIVPNINNPRKVFRNGAPVKLRYAAPSQLVVIPVSGITIIPRTRRRKKTLSEKREVNFSSMMVSFFGKYFCF
jgi:hypothetical protein